MDSVILFKFAVTSWLFCLTFLLIIFGSVMAFPSLVEIYLQRDLGRANNLFEGYLQTYFGYVLSPVLLIYGLTRKNYFLTVAGCAGGLILFMITAEKSVLMYPVFICILYIGVKSKNKIFLKSSFILLLLATLIALSTFFFKESDVARFLAGYVGARSILTPGLFIPLYNNYFGDVGYTFGTHISGVSIFIDVPSQFLNHFRWPSLGHLVGEEYIGIPTLNANANFIASDGIASFGLLGVIASCLLFSIFLLIIDFATRGTSPAFSLPLLLPLSLILSNGSLFTAMMSFGGFFYIFVFAFLFRKKLNF